MKGVREREGRERVPTMYEEDEWNLSYWTQLYLGM